MAKGINKIDWQKIAFACEVSDEHRQNIYDKFIGSKIKTEKLSSKDDEGRFAFRLNQKGRVICTTTKVEGVDCLVILNVDPKHKYDTNSALNKGAADKAIQELDGAIFNDRDLKSEDLPDGIRGASTYDGKILVYTKEQGSAIDSFEANLGSGKEYKITPKIINGLAGAGKTSVALQILSDASEKGIEAIYLTKSSRLVSSVKEQLGMISADDISDSSSVVSSSDDGDEDDFAPEPVERRESIKNNIKCLSYEKLAADGLFFHFKGFVNTHFLDSKSKYYDLFQQALDIVTQDEDEVAEYDPIDIITKKIIEYYKFPSENDLSANDSKILDNCISTYFQESLIGKDSYVEWFSKKLKSKSKALYIKEFKKLDSAIKPNAEEMYLEIQKAHMQLGKRGTLYKDIHESESSKDSLATSILKAYLSYLNENKLIDPSLLFAQFSSEEISSINTEIDDSNDAELEEKSDELVLLLDEAQSFTPLELSFAIDRIKSEYSDKHVTFYLCRDGNQSLSDPFDLTLHTIHELTGHDIKEEVFDLNTSFRTPANITRLANRILNIKGQVIGGKLHKVDASSSESAELPGDEEFDSATDNEGYIDWIDSKEFNSASDKLKLLQEASQNIVDCVIVAFGEKARIEAASKFPQGLVLLPNEVVGLEYKKVILYKPFSDGNDSSLLNMGDLFRELYDASKIAPSNFPKSANNLKYVLSFNEFFVAITRSMNSLHIIDGDLESGLGKKVKTKGGFFHEVLKDILDASAAGDTMHDDVGELGLKELVSYIESKKKIYPPKLLVKYIAIATERLESDDVSQMKINDLYKISKKLSSIFESIESGKYTDRMEFLSQGAKSDSEATQSDFLLEKLQKLQEKFKPEAIKTNISLQTTSEPAFSSSASKPKEPENVKTSTKSDKKPSLSVNSAAAKAGKQIKSKPKFDSAKTKQLKRYLNKPINLDCKEIIKLIEKGADPIAKNKYGCSAFHAVTQYMHDEKAIKFVLNKVTDIDVQTFNSCTALVLAVDKNNKVATKLLLEHGANVHYKDFEGYTAFQIATKYGFIDLAKILLDYGSDINTQENSGYTPLIGAVAENSLEVVKFLLKNKADVQKACNSNSHPLHFVNSKEMVEILLDSGADINAKTKEGRTPLFSASRSIDAMIELVSRGANIYIKDNEGNVFIDNLLYETLVEFFEKLVDKYITKPDQITKHGIITPIFKLIQKRGMDDADLGVFKKKYQEFMISYKSAVPVSCFESEEFESAASNNIEENEVDDALISRALEELKLESEGKSLDVRDNINIRNELGETAIHNAARLGQSETIERLIDLGADINAQTNRLLTPLHYAALKSNSKTIVQLLEKGADPKITNVKSKTFIDCMDDGSKIALIRDLAKSKQDDNQKSIIDKVYLMIKPGFEGENVRKLVAEYDAFNEAHNKKTKIFNDVYKHIIESHNYTKLVEYLNKNSNLTLNIKNKSKLFVAVAKNPEIFDKYRVDDKCFQIGIEDVCNAVRDKSIQDEYLEVLINVAYEKKVLYKRNKLNESVMNVAESVMNSSASVYLLIAFADEISYEDKKSNFKNIIELFKINPSLHRKMVLEKLCKAFQKNVNESEAKFFVKGYIEYLEALNQKYKPLSLESPKSKYEDEADIDLTKDFNEKIEAILLHGAPSVLAAHLNRHNDLVISQDNLDKILKEEMSLPLMGKAIQMGMIGLIEKLIDIGLSVDMTSSSSFGLMHIAAQHGRVDSIRKLSELGVNINSYDGDGLTPLHIAAQYDHINSIVQLIKEGADPESKNAKGETFLYSLSYDTKLSVFSKLIDSKLGNTPKAAIDQVFKLISLQLSFDDRKPFEVLYKDYIAKGSIHESEPFELSDGQIHDDHSSDVMGASFEYEDMA